MVMMFRFISVLAVVIGGNYGLAQDDSTKSEINQLRQILTESINKSDIQTVFDHCTTDVCLTSSDGVACRGKQAIKDYYHKMIKAPSRRYESFSTATELEGIAL